MSEITLVTIPALFGAICFLLSRHRKMMSVAFLLSSAIFHMVLSIYLSVFCPYNSDTSWIGIDSLNSIFLLLTSLLFLVSSVYLLIIFAMTDEYDSTEACKTSSCLQFFLSAMTLVILSRHLGFMWVGMETTTLATAPLIYLHRNRSSLEASWKYLIICSVGIGLSLIGNIFLVSAFNGGGNSYDYLLLHNLQNHGHIVNKGLIKIAFIFFLVGYGTKMGLVPLHTWLPDAHSESPAFVSALLSGSLLNCAFLALIRITHICRIIGEGNFSDKLLILFGLVTVLAAGIFIIRQTDIKRMLAYSSIENMGILAFGLGIGGFAGLGTILHMINHSLTKGMLFLTAGIIYMRYKTREVPGISGVLKEIPLTGLLWLAGGIALCGMPPFGLFLSKFIIIKNAFDCGKSFESLILLGFIAVGAVGLIDIFIKTVYGKTKPLKTKNSYAEDQPVSKNLMTVYRLLSFSPLVLGIFSMVLCFYIPPFISDVMKNFVINITGLIP